MSRRKRLLVNPSEVATDAVLREVATKYGTRVYPKVRIADALEIAESELTDEEYSYALRAHFDFVVTSDGNDAAFVVEFDGSTHDRLPEVIRRDVLKSTICQKLGMPLLRIDEGALRRAGRSSVLGWLAEIWFHYDAFITAQERGDIPPDEIFDYTLILGQGLVENGRFVELSIEEAAKVPERWPELILTRPYFISQSARVLIRRSYERGECSAGYPEELASREPGGHATALALVPLPNDLAVIGTARCRSFSFPPISPREVAQELAVVDAGEKLRQYFQGQYRPESSREVEERRECFAQWRTLK